MSTLGQDLDKLADLKAKEAILSRRLADAKRTRMLHEREVYDRMTEEGYDPGESSIKRRGKVHYPATRPVARIQDKAVLTDYLKAHDMGVIEEKLMQGELNHLVREHLDNGAELPPGLGFDIITTVQTRGVTKKDADTREEESDNDPTG